MRPFQQMGAMTIAYLSADNISKKTRGDRVIWGIVILLSMLSLLLIYSATSSLAFKQYQGNSLVYLFKQMMFVLIGILVIYTIHQLNYMVFSRLAVFLFYLSIPLMLFTVLYGTRINDSSRWLRIPIIHVTVQTSDFAKLTLYIYISRLLSKNQAVIKDFKQGCLPILIPVVVTCFLILPSNLSNCLLTGITCLIIMFIGRVSIKHLMGIVLVALIPIGLLILFAVTTYKPQQDTTIVKTEKVVHSRSFFNRFSTWVKRIQDFIYVSDNETPYQVKQAKIAIAKGGVFFGLGPGNSIQKNFLPQAYNDFIYAIIIEEYGLLGGLVIIFIYLIFLFRCIRIFIKCPYGFGAFLALTLSLSLTTQAVINMLVNVNILPVTGVTLPLVSMGGSSFLFTCTAIGIILSVARNVEDEVAAGREIKNELV
ncbi:MAG: FtsW/RodA/SpoVE family cell cycle protein [Phycisphaerales bacterium]|nr:FtsW/RodA/SpoVE family cell cycle protein [Phycisphaerales bacterium]